LLFAPTCCWPRPNTLPQNPKNRTPCKRDLPPDALQQQIVSKEREELQCLKTGNLKHFAELLADDAIFVDDHGAASKSEIVEHTPEFRLTEYTIDDVKFVPPSTTSGLVSYKISERGNSHGKEFTAQVYVSALWAERGGKMVCVFSQETAAK
jgi:hypothetical protein